MGDVVDLNRFQQQQRAKVPPQSSDKDLGERLERIKASIGRINQIMSELRAMTSKEGDVETT